ncbi:MAG TPA: TonB-dependent receptor [Candidatus Baltobacteraceae bacterium]|jgi:hypothetical protein
MAQSASQGTVSGVVTDTNAGPIAGALISLSGPQVTSTTSGSDGTFSVNVAAGTYTISVTKSGFERQTQGNVVVVSGQTNSVNVSLAAQTMTSLQVIGHVSTSAGARGSINTSPASTAVISQQTMQDQGIQQVMQILDETPGIIAQYPGGTANPSAPASVSYPVIRGALPYETESLIDGHPLANQSYGDFVITYLNPYLLQSIEVVKGPGASATQDNNAINGTVNFRTLEPTTERRESVVFGVDSFGGNYSNFRATGTVLNGKLGYALDYAITGTPGPLQNAQSVYTGFTPDTIINGIPNGGYAATAPATLPAKIQNPPYNVDSLYGCCYPLNTQYLNRGELVKLRWNFSGSTTLTASYIGSQVAAQEISTGTYNLPMVFEPAAGYTATGNGAVPGQTINTITGVYQPPNQPESNNAPLFQVEFRTAPTPNDVILARYYTAELYRELSNGIAGPTGTYTTNMTLNGSFTPAAPNSAPIIFNNQLASVSFIDQYFQEVEFDQLHGGSFEYDHALGGGAGLLSVAVDSTATTSESYEYEPALAAYGIPPGSQVAETTEMLRGIFNLSPHLQLTLANYFNEYSYHYSSDNGVTWQNPHSWYDVPRGSLVWQPNSNTAIRAAAGSAIAPAYLYLLSTQNTAPTSEAGGTYYQHTVAPPTGSVFPETAFGYDLGGDMRLGGYKTLSVDGYWNNLRNQFVKPYYLQGYCLAPCTTTVPASTAGAVPLYGQTVENLSNSRYAGLEGSFKNDPPVGLGGIVNLSLIRAYAYDINPCFYSSDPTISCSTASQNLGIVPYANFGSSNSVSADGKYNTLGDAVPYAQGYGEIHYRFPRGGLVLLGTTFYGNNNTFQRSSFYTFNATLRAPIYDAHTFAQVSVYNLFNTWGAGYGTAFVGTPEVVLANGNFALTNAKSLMPTTFRFQISHDFGAK